MQRSRTFIQSILTTALVLAMTPSPASELALEDLGNFLEPFYQKPSEKKLVDDLAVFGERLYIAHGTTNTKVKQVILWYDLATGSFDCVRDDAGQPKRWPIEKTFVLNDLGTELAIVDYDPIGTNAFLFRITREGELTVQRPSGDAHNRDITKHDGVWWCSYGHSKPPWPSMRVSYDDGATWQSYQAQQEWPRALYHRYIPWRDQLYATTYSLKTKEGFDIKAAIKKGGDVMAAIQANMIPNDTVPWMITVNGTGKDAHWQAVHQIPQDLLPPHPGVDVYASTLAINSFEACQAGLVVEAAGYSWLITSIQPPAAQALPLEAPWLVTDMAADGDTIYALATRRGKPDEAIVQQIMVLRDAEWVSLGTLPEGSPANCLAISQSYAYLAYRGGRLQRAALPQP
ncbi:MAG: hypothetical protein PF961_02320 [Planctomycetota bacterium]|jgi:hypothetical protein|nr:hypothetical protein [Planctomycetota bacterium]